MSAASRWGALLALAWICAAAGACGGPGRVEARDAWVEPPPAGHGPAGGFLTLENATDRARRLVGASSPATERIEIHRSWMEGDVARMERLETVEFPAGETVGLAPGGVHLMLFGAHGLEPGTSVVLQLELDGGEALEVEAAVRRSGAAHHHHP